MPEPMTPPTPVRCSVITGTTATTAQHAATVRPPVHGPVRARVTKTSGNSNHTASALSTTSSTHRPSTTESHGPVSRRRSRVVRPAAKRFSHTVPARYTTASRAVSATTAAWCVGEYPRARNCTSATTSSAANARCTLSRSVSSNWARVVRSVDLSGVGTSPSLGRVGRQRIVRSVEKETIHRGDVPDHQGREAWEAPKERRMPCTWHSATSVPRSAGSSSSGPSSGSSPCSSSCSPG